MPLDTASILIAEDEEPIRRLLTRILTDAGYTTLEADTGDHALTMLDLHMPGQVDGEELLFQLRDQSYEIPKQPDQRTALRTPHGNSNSWDGSYKTLPVAWVAVRPL